MKEIENTESKQIDKSKNSKQNGKGYFILQKKKRILEKKTIFLNF